MRVDVVKSRDQDDNFYALMGCHFASLEHKKELGGWQVYNKENSIWFLIFNEIGKLVGFCVLFEEKSWNYLDNFVILKEYRGKKYSNLLFKFVINYIIEKKLIMRVISNNLIMLKKFDSIKIMKIIGNRGTYKVYQLDCS